MLKLEIVTPERKVFDGTADMVSVPTSTGEVGILPDHAPLISALKAGVLSYSHGGTVERLVVAGGFVEVSDDNVSVLVDSAQTVDEIDPATVRAELEAAAATLRETVAPVEEADELWTRYDTANARLQLIGGK